MASASTSGASALSLIGISKHYGDVRALDDVSFELKKGEFLTMLGPSGSGKTTSLRVIAGFVAPTSGRLLVDGRDMTGVEPQRRNIGMMFQDYALFPHMTVVDNVAYPLEARGVSRFERRKRAMEMLEIVGLAHCAGRFPKQMSGGQQQRVALARALVFNPDIVLLDEPMAALDKKLRSQMQIEIMHITKQVGATVVSVTHDQEEALVMSDRIAIFKDGRLAQIGNPQELYTHPKSEFVADFIGEANILRGGLRKDGETAVIEGPGWRATVPATDPRIAASGTKPALVLRPERIHVNAEGADPGNGATGTIADKIYLGTEFRLIVRLADGATVQLRSRDMATIAPLQANDQIHLSWQVDDLVVIPA